MNGLISLEPPTCCSINVKIFCGTLIVKVSKAKVQGVLSVNWIYVMPLYAVKKHMGTKTN